MASELPVSWMRLHLPGETNPAIAAALLTTHALIHQTARAKPAPVKKPEVSSGGTTEGWTYFLQRWRSYVQAVQLTDADIPVQLLECCDSKLRRDVTRNSIGPLPIEGKPSGSHQVTCSEGREPESGQGGTLPDDAGPWRANPRVRSQASWAGGSLPLHEEVPWL